MNTTDKESALQGWATPVILASMNPNNSKLPDPTQAMGPRIASFFRNHILFPTINVTIDSPLTYEQCSDRLEANTGNMRSAFADTKVLGMYRSGRFYFCWNYVFTRRNSNSRELILTVQQTEHGCRFQGVVTTPISNYFGYVAMLVAFAVLIYKLFLSGDAVTSGEQISAISLFIFAAAILWFSEHWECKNDMKLIDYITKTLEGTAKTSRK